MERCFHSIKSIKEKGEGTIVPPFHHAGIHMFALTLWEVVKNKCFFSVSLSPSYCLVFFLVLSTTLRLISIAYVP